MEAIDITLHLAIYCIGVYRTKQHTFFDQRNESAYRFEGGIRKMMIAKELNLAAFTNKTRISECTDE